MEEVTFNILRNNYCDLHELTSDQVKGRIASSIEFLLKQDYVKQDYVKQDYEVIRTILKEKKE